jgi:hypothetical protein
MITGHSDHDLYVVLADGAATSLTQFTGHRTPELDLVIVSVAEFRAAGMPGFERYALARALVVLDRLGGGIARALAAKARLTPEGAFRVTGEYLDVCQLPVPLRQERPRRTRARRPPGRRRQHRFLLELLFALNRRPRPYNKYLERELARYPLPGWDAGGLLDAVDRISGTGDMVLQRQLFARVEETARRAGRGAVLDAWGGDLELMRPR